STAAELNQMIDDRRLHELAAITRLVHEEVEVAQLRMAQLMCLRIRGQRLARVETHGEAISAGSLSGGYAGGDRFNGRQGYEFQINRLLTNTHTEDVSNVRLKRFAAVRTKRLGGPIVMIAMLIETF